MKRWLDRVTGIVTMYKLVLMLLAAIWVVALVLSLLGQFRSGPLELIVFTAVTMATTWASSLLIAKVARVSPHVESAFITGFLIAMILPPTLEPLGLLGAAVAGVLASASKYLIAVRGRHIFNPAAFAVVVVGLVAVATELPLGRQAWWPGGSLFLIPVAIGAFLVLYRTQHVSMGLLFGGVVLVVRPLAALIEGGDPLAALQFTLAQDAWIFLAGFMLSEPLTLPPRRWQRFLVAMIVGVLYAVPSDLVHIGFFTLSPAFALLIGNLVGFAFGQRRGIRMTYTGKTQVGSDTWELTFQPANPVRFLPGQYMELTIPHRRQDFRGKRRYFSIASAPGPDAPLTFAMTMPSKASSFKRALLELEPGSRVDGTLVGGDFGLPADPKAPVLLVAGGIGITPFASQVAHAVAGGHDRDIVVVYATSALGELPYGMLLRQAGVPVILFAPQSPADLPANWVYAGAGRATADRIAEHVGDVASRHVYVSGPPGLVADLKQALRPLGVRRFHADSFSGY